MTTVDEILDCLSRERVRATYGAVGEVLGLPPQRIWRTLRNHTEKASWIVNARTGEPTDHPVDQRHPDLHRTSHIFKTGAELSELLSRAEPETVMTDNPPAIDFFDSDNIARLCRDITPHAAAEALREACESRRRQDAKLYWWLRIGAATLVLYIAAMAVFSAASGRFASLSAVLMFVGGLLLLLTLAGAGVPSLQWNQEPRVDRTLLGQLSQHATPQETDLHLIDIHLRAHKQNKTKLRNVRLGMGIHIAVAVTGSVFALFALLEIVPSLIDSPDPPACVECLEDTQVTPTSSSE